ncbi:MAG: ABC transporter permease [Clostridia bacterium]|nr:ABC transporter permease [Clostridia bacterium]
MNTANKTAKYFSWPLMKQTIRSNRVLTVAIMIVMILICVVISIARNMMISGTTDSSSSTTFITYLYVIASSGLDYDYEGLMAGLYDSDYTALFAMLDGYSLEEFKQVAAALVEAGSYETSLSTFEYNWAFADAQGIFSGNALDINEFMGLMMESMGMSSDLLENMEGIDMSSMLNQMYYTIMGILPLLVYIVVVGNSLIASQVDRGSMAYVLSTPTKRSAVAITQAIYMIVVPFIMIAVTCCVKIAMSAGLSGDADAAATIMLYFGMYILIEAMAGLCYLGSCLFNRSGKSMAFGGGLTVWFFLASLLGMFGSDNLVQMGMGVEILGVFNNLTLIGLFDIDSLATVGTDAVSYTFIWKLAILFVIAAAAYIGGAVRFTKKDLPL